MRQAYSYMPLLTLAAVMAAFPAAAQEEAQGPDDPDQLTIGVGAGVIPSYEGSNDSRVIPGFFLRGRVAGHPVFTRGTALFIDLIPNETASGLDIGVGPVAGARLNRTGSIKDDRVEALGKLDTAWELGGWAGIAKTGVITSDYDNLSFRVSWVHDVADAHGGYVITPALEYGTPLSRTAYAGLSLSANYVGKGYGRYYYDIDAAGSLASGLAAYGDAGRKSGFARINAGLALGKSLSGDLRKGWAVFALGGYSRILGRYADSPIVADAGSRDQWMGGIGLAYTF